VIRDHILQSLAVALRPLGLHNHQTNALVILLKLAGAAPEACADPSVVDRCFKLVKGHYSRGSARGGLVQVRTSLSGNLRPPG